MNNPNDNLNQEKQSGTDYSRGADLIDPDKPNRDITINAEAESKNQLGQLSKEVQNKNRGSVDAQTFDINTLRGDSAKEKVLPSLVQAIIGLVIILIITLCLSLLTKAGFTDYWVSLPLQSYWCYWLFALNRAFGKQYKCASPLRLIELILLCSFSYTFCLL